MKQWIDPLPVDVPSALTAAIDGQHILLETLIRRGFTNAEAAQRFLNPDLYIPASPDELPDMQKGVERIERAVAAQEFICVWGDFDVDGQTSTTLLVSALTQLGGKVRHYIPNRQQEGHGVHIPRLKMLIDDGVQLIVTCDTGIAAHDAVNYANSRHVDVVITDHHQLPAELPAAYAAINPQRLPEGHPLRTLPGVGAAYKVVEALYNRAGRVDELPEFLDLVALGIVADVAEQIGDARYLLQKGLIALRRTERLGLQVMMQQADIKPEKFDEDDIGFGIAPRLNALGRLDDANVIVEFLTTTDLERARVLSNQLEALNAQRRMMTNQVYKAAQEQISRDPALLNYSVLLLAHDTWPGGIVGLVASRLVEQYNRPVLLLTTGGGNIARGSARSISGCDITAAIAQNADLLEGYGGHTMAAGLGIQAERIPDLRRKLSRTVQKMLQQTDTTPTLAIDAYVPLDEIGVDLLKAVQQLAPFGAGNPPLVLASRNLRLKEHRWMGRTNEHLRLTVEDEQGKTHDAVWWQADMERLPKGRFDLAYTIHANAYQGNFEVQLQFVDARPVSEIPLTFAERTTVDIVDHRLIAAPHEALKSLTGDYIIWGEGDNLPIGFTACRRDTLEGAATLVIWSAPPGPNELRQALEKSNPDSVVLMGVKPGMDSVQVFLRTLGGLVKHTLNEQHGETTFLALASALSHREATIKTGLDWMVTHGHIHYTIDGDRVKITQSDGTPKGDRGQATALIGAALRETAAYRAYFQRAEANTLIQLD